MLGPYLEEQPAEGIKGESMYGMSSAGENDAETMNSHLEEAAQGGHGEGSGLQMLPEGPRFQEERLVEDHSCHVKPLLDPSTQDQISQDALLSSFCLFPAPSYKEDFRFCAERRQTVEGHVRYEIQQDAITISNGADGLNISAPFPPGPQQSWALPTLLGTYRFCVYWFQDDRLFNLTYGISHTYQLSNQANYSFSSLNYTCQGSRDGPNLLNNISYAFNNGSVNHSLPSITECKFEEMRQTELKLKSLETHHSSDENGPPEDPFLFLHQLESKLGELEFQGDRKSFEGTVMHANVQKVPPQIPANVPIEVTLKKTRDGIENGEMKVVVVSATSKTLFQDDSNSLLGGNVVGISVGNMPVHGLPKEERISITFWHHPLQVSSPDIDHIHYEYLTIVTYVGCIISALASLFTIFFFLCSKKKQRDHIVYVHMNLLWAIFLLDMSFLIAVPLAPTRDTACKAGGMFLHFGVLACLTWMAIEGYSLPICIVCLIFVIDQSHYGPTSFKVYEAAGEYTNSTICWITKKEINNFLNLGYLSLVLFFNSIMLATMVYEILKLRHREHHWEYVVMLLGLSCVLGIPWGLVFFAFTSGTFKLVAVYLFTIINSLQGFLIFLWYLAKVLQSRRSNSMQCTTSNSLKLQSSSTSI
ncbi:hypothetical protein E2320_001024 [Naja naja]|nr:hypothetical protein E2320_001024 [Naja naja]